MTDKTKRCPKCGCEHDGNVLQCDCGESLSDDNDPAKTSGFGKGIVALVGGALAIPLGWTLLVNVNDGTVSYGSALSDMLMLTCGGALALGGLLCFIAGAFMTARSLVGRKK